MCKTWKMKTTKHHLEKLKMTNINGEIYYFHNLEESILCYDISSSHIDLWTPCNSSKNPCKFSLSSRSSPVDSKIIWKLKWSGIAKMVLKKGKKQRTYTTWCQDLLWCYSNKVIWYLYTSWNRNHPSMGDWILTKVIQCRKG